jgi:DNA-directed RNA polymerase specialized sigma24 family protein
LHDARLARVLALEDIERFAYVLAVLEGYPDQNCAVLLGISRQEVRETRIRAIERIANFDTKHCTAKAPLAATRN